MTSRMDATRREALKAVAVGASGLALASVASRAVTADSPTVEKGAKESRDRSHPDEVRAQAVREFLGELVPGARIGVFTLIAVDPMDRGGIPLTLSTPEGEAFGVDVLRHDPTAPSRGIGPSTVVSVFLRNGGNGRTSTDETKGLGAIALAEALELRVRAGAVPPLDMLTMSERAAASIA